MLPEFARRPRRQWSSKLLWQMVGRNPLEFPLDAGSPKTEQVAF
jgi:hypothetical protein